MTSAVATIEPIRGHDPQVIFDWLVALTQFTNNKAQAVENAESKTLAWVHAAMEDFPVRAFTQKTFRCARQQFEFFPSYGELYKFLEKYLTEHPLFDARYFLPNAAEDIAKLPEPKTPAEYQSWFYAQQGSPHKAPGMGDGT